MAFLMPQNDSIKVRTLTAPREDPIEDARALRGSIADHTSSVLIHRRRRVRAIADALATSRLVHGFRLRYGWLGLGHQLRDSILHVTKERRGSGSLYLL